MILVLSYKMLKNLHKIYYDILRLNVRWVQEDSNGGTEGLSW